MEALNIEMVGKNKYRCARCGGVFKKIRNKRWNDEKVIEEAKALFGENAVDEEHVIVCTKCHIELLRMTVLDAMLEDIRNECIKQLQ